MVDAHVSPLPAAGVLTTFVAVSAIATAVEGVTPEWHVLAAGGVLMPLLGWLAHTDAAERRLPDVGTLPVLLGAGALSLSGLSPVAPHDALLGLVSLGGTFLVAALATARLAPHGGVGLGDVKLAAGLGALLGLTAGCLMVAVAGALGLAAHFVAPASSREGIPAGLWMALATAAVLPLAWFGGLR